MKISTTQNKLWVKIAVIVAWLFVWQIIYWVVNKDILVVSPIDAFKTLVGFFADRGFWKTVIFSLTRVMIGYLLAVIFALLMACVTARFNILYIFFNPLIALIKSTPVASFIILALLWLKTNTVPVFIAFLMCFPLVYGNVYQGIVSTDKSLLEMAKVYGFGVPKKIKLIYIPSVLPYFVSSALTALGFAWKSGIAAEVICTPKFSIGRELYNSKIYLEMPELFAWTTAIVILSIIVEKIFVLGLNKAKSKFIKVGISSGDKT